MKNIILGSIFALVFLPQISFGQSQSPVDASPAPAAIPSTISCSQLDVQSSAFFQGQAGERGAFIKAHPDSIAKHDQRFRAQLAISMAQRTGKSTAGLPTPPDEDSAFLAFQQKQQSDKITFLEQLNQEKQNCTK